MERKLDEESCSLAQPGLPELGRQDSCPVTLWVAPSLGGSALGGRQGSHDCPTQSSHL